MFSKYFSLLRVFLLNLLARVTSFAVGRSSSSSEFSSSSWSSLPRKNFVAVTSILVSLLKQPVAITFTVLASLQTFFLYRVAITSSEVLALGIDVLDVVHYVVLQEGSQGLVLTPKQLEE